MSKTMWILYIAFVFSPLYVVLVGKMSLNQTVNPTIISGLITASGIFFGIMTASLISRSEVLEHDIRFLIYMDLVLFGFPFISIFYSALWQNTTTVGDLTVIMTSLLANLYTATVVVNRLRFHQ